MLKNLSHPPPPYTQLYDLSKIQASVAKLTSITACRRGIKEGLSRGERPQDAGGSSAQAPIGCLGRTGGQDGHTDGQKRDREQDNAL